MTFKFLKYILITIEKCSYAVFSNICYVIVKAIQKHGSGEFTCNNIHRRGTKINVVSILMRILGYLL